MSRNPDNPIKCPQLMKDGIHCMEKSINNFSSGDPDELVKCPFIKDKEVLDEVKIQVSEDFTDEEQELIRERLRRLGYLE